MTAKAQSRQARPTSWLVLACALLGAFFGGRGTPAAASPSSPSLPWTLTASIPVRGARAGRFLSQPYSFAVSRTQEGGGGVWRVGRFGPTAPLVKGESAQGMLATHDTLFISLASSSGIWRVDWAGSSPEDAPPTLWVSGFGPGPDALAGLAKAPAKDSSAAWVVIRQGASLPAVWSWSLTHPQGELPVWWGTQDGLADPVDVAVSASGAVWIADAGAGGRLLWAAAPGGALAAKATSLLLPTSVAVDPVTHRPLVLDAGAGALATFDPASSTVLSLWEGLTVEPGAWSALDVHADGSQLLVTAKDALYVLTRCSAPPPTRDCDANGAHDACDIAAGAGADCDGDEVLDSCEIAESPALDCNAGAGADGTLDACQGCPRLDIVVVMDTSVSMNDEALPACDAAAALDAQLAAHGVEARTTWLGITESPGGPFGCLEGSVVSVLGAAPPAGGEALGALGQCPGGIQAPNEDWGRAVAIVSDRFPWWPDAERIIVPLVDEGAYCGDPLNPFDDAALALAAQLAMAHGVRLAPGLGSGVNTSLIIKVAAAAAATGGNVWSIATSAGEPVAVPLSDAITANCAAPLDCDGDQVSDACAVEASIDIDCDGDEVPDACAAAGAPELDSNGDGVLDACIPPPAMGCASSCCLAHDAPGCQDAYTSACVCQLEESCCDESWAPLCTWLAKQVCRLPCPSSAVCTAFAKPTPGCGSSPCEACVCSAIGACCDESWGAACVQRAQQECATPCDAVKPMPCHPVAGDVNADGAVNVTDAQCILLTVLWSLRGIAGPPPSCLAGVPLAADLSCDCKLTVTDLVTAILYAFDLPLDQALDANADACPDSCAAQ